MKQDITAILKAWRFDPEANVRKIQGEDGVEKVQVRIDQGAFQGILQLNLDGRPDGHKPHGYDFALDHYRSALEKNCEDDAQFSLGQAECKELFDEGARLYERYAFLLQLKDYQRVVRDTERNMSLFRFVNRYAEQEEDRLNLEKWWPYILRINGTARAILTGEKQDYVQALEIVEQTREQIRQCAEVDVEEFYAEQERSERALDELQRNLQAKIPLSHLQQLQRMLETAIAKEDFERAALLRDELEKLRDGSELQEGI
jgi:hypothetical protein